MILIPGSPSFAKLVTMSSAPAKSAGGEQIHVPRSSHSLNQRCPIQSRLQSVLGEHSYYDKRNYTLHIQSWFGDKEA